MNPPSSSEEGCVVIGCAVVAIGIVLAGIVSLALVVVKYLGS